MDALAKTYFLACAIVAIGGAFAVITSKNPIRGAMGLLLLILAVAGLFVSLQALFLAFIQLIVYAGAVVVLFLFVIMLLGPSAVAPRDQRGIVMRAFGALGFAVFMLWTIVPLMQSAHAHGQTAASPDFGGIEAFGWTLFTDGLVPFELSSALLMVAVLGAVAVARGRQGEPARVRPSSELETAATRSPAKPRHA